MSCFDIYYSTVCNKLRHLDTREEKIQSEFGTCPGSYRLYNCHKNKLTILAITHCFKFMPENDFYETYQTDSALLVTHPSLHLKEPPIVITRE